MNPAEVFTRESISICHVFARKVLNDLNLDKIYVFDNSEFFDDSDNILVSGYRVKLKDDKYAFLSSTVQSVNWTYDVYLRYTNDEIYSDEIGLYLKRNG